MSRVHALVALLMIGVTGSLAHAARVRTPDLHVDLASLPFHISGWTGRDAPPLDEETLRILGADAYLERSYAAASRSPVDLYVAYYGRQQPGASIHSPLHCLPGTGGNRSTFRRSRSFSPAASRVMPGAFSSARTATAPSSCIGMPCTAACWRARP